MLQAMRALNYRRNTAATALVTQRSSTIGVIGFESTLFGPASMLYSIEDAAREAGYFVSVVTVRSLEREPVLEAIDRLWQQDVEGLVAIAPKYSVHNALVQAPGGLVCVGVGGASDTTVPTVRVDNAGGAALATQHLLDLGHATVHHVAGPADWPEAQERVAGWRAALYAAVGWSHQWTTGTGAPAPGTREAERWQPTPTSRLCSAPTTRSRWEYCEPCTKPAGGSGGRQRGRVRRRAGSRVLSTAADHDPAGFRRARPAGDRGPARSDPGRSRSGLRRGPLR